MSKKKKTVKKGSVVYDEWDFYPHYKDASERYADRLGWMVEACESVAYEASDPEGQYPIFIISSIGNPDKPPYITMFCYFTKHRKFGLLKEIKRAAV